MPKLLAWEKNWLCQHGWNSQQLAQLEQSSEETPTAYLCGQAAFLDLSLHVSPATLIPRLETETLYQLCLPRCCQIARCASSKQIVGVDIGTGSGALAIALARALTQKKLPGKILASDISTPALQIAQKNVAKYHLQQRIILLRANLLATLGKLLPAKTPWFLIANLPYIPKSELAHLPKSVKNYEPHLALNGGNDGWQLIKKLLTQCSHLDNPPTNIYLEIDPSQQKKFATLGQKYYWHIYPDFNNLPRLAVGKLATP